MPEPIVKPEASVEPNVKSNADLELVELVSCDFEEFCVVSECDDNLSSQNISLESNVNTDKNQTCIYCDQKTK